MVLGLHGKAGSGKDATYHALLDRFGSQRRVVREAFADRLKLSAARALGFDGPLEEAIAFCNRLKEGGAVTTELGWPQRRLNPPELSVSGRKFLQRYGTEAHRDIFDGDFWVNQVLPPAQRGAMWDSDTLFVITDVRFENEARAIAEAGGVVWHIIRPSLTTEDTHVSEQPLPPELLSRTLTNDGGLDELGELAYLAARADFPRLWKVRPVCA